MHAAMTLCALIMALIVLGANTFGNFPDHVSYIDLGSAGVFALIAIAWKDK